MSSRGGKRGRLRRAVILVAVASAAASLLVAGPSAGLTPGLLGTPPPASQLPQSRCGSLSFSPHVVKVGQKVTGTVGYAGPEACGGNIPPLQRPTWTWSYEGRRVAGCGENDLTCVFEPTHPTSGWAVSCLNGNSRQGAWGSCDYYAAVGKHDAVIEGTVVNKDKQPVAGVEVDAYGPGSYVATSGADGSYALDVKPGTYRVIPDGKALAKSPPTFMPARLDLPVRAGDRATADFVIDAGLVVKLKLSATSVPASGFAVVSGTVTTSEYGRPDPNVTVALWPNASESPDLAVTTGARATICSTSGRLWPGGTLSDPEGESVNVTTDQNGSYAFTLTVGTVPGEFELTAWARDASGNLITTDTADTADKQTLTVTATGEASASALYSALAHLTGTSALGSMTNDAGSIATTLAGLTQTTNGEVLKGLAFAETSGSKGETSALVYPAANPPGVGRAGALVITSATGSNTLVLDPSEWAGFRGFTGPLNQAMQEGKLGAAPTLAQWSSGALVAGWTLPAEGQTMSVDTQSFQWLGWPYPSSAPGACS